MTSRTFAGIERHVVSLTSELQALGCAAEIACPPAAHRLRAESAAAGVPLVPSSHRWLTGVASHIVRERPDVLHVNDGRSAIVAAALSHATPSLVIRTQHFTRPASAVRAGWSGRASRQIHRLINHRLDGYIGVSRSVIDAGRERGEIGGRIQQVIPPAICLPDDEAWSQARAIRAQLDHPVVAFVGRLESERRLDTLLRAIPLVLAHLPNCHVLIAGSGSAEDALRRLAARLGVAKAITWTGWLTQPDAAFARAHAYVNTWPWEGFGMAMAEAMAFALPVIAVNSGASSEMVADGVTGMLVPAEDEAALAEAIVRLLSDLERVAEMGDAARRYSLATYGAKRTAEATLALYRRLQDGASL